MPAGSLLALLDDIATVLDDVSVMTKVAAKKTAGVLGDDLALNAQQVTGVSPHRELPVVWAVTKGSVRNKLILVPAALLISAFAPWAVTPLLMLGGLFLCFEGFEKITHRYFHPHAAQRSSEAAPEEDKIRGAVRTDFILSAEIIAITLGAVAGAPFVTQLAVLVGISALMTVGVYGLVAGIVKLDDAGLHLARREGTGGAARLQRALGRGILVAAPWLMKTLSVAGTAAMFLVGGGILTHGIAPLHHAIEAFVPQMAAWPAVGGAAAVAGPVLLDGLVGIAAGALVWAVVAAVQKMRGRGH